MIRFLRVAYSIPHFPFLCNSISKLSLPLIPTFWEKKRRGTLERVPRTPQNFHKCALTRVLPVMFKWLRPEGITSAARVQPRGCKGRSLPASQHRPGLAAGVPGAPAPGKINQKSPPSPRGKGVGGWGQKSKLKARSAGGKEGKPPPDSGTPPSFVSRETSPLPCSVSRETSPPPFHVKHPLPCFT